MGLAGPQDGRNEIYGRAVWFIWLRRRMKAAEHWGEAVVRPHGVCEGPGK